MNLEKKFYLPNRIAALSDGIFAIAMTILVLNINIPDKDLVKQIGLLNALLAHVQEFYSYFLSFFLLGVFWGIQHKHMNAIEKTDSGYIWLNIILLMFICLIPFSASLQSVYNGSSVSSTIFGCNMLIIGFFLMLNWRYATKDHKLIAKDYSRENIVKGKKYILIFILVTIAAIIIGLFTPDYSGITFLLIPILKAFTK
ncbi:MAG TPA: TMEM175 family protein [Bacteroidales bacterium]|jgi:uncharacterized membrane protein|nr:hypothetical protein [Bacteroidota bacterium]HJN06647.1 TMEM175 family protein [Bacteroidales bacterium]|tara:strand:+ start:5081 stop:5677 length:597 start_codon:yes stop_codon:yes gene_type:complete